MSATVSLIDFTGSGFQGAMRSEYAARLLAFTKNTRLQMNPSGFLDWVDKPWEEIEPEIAYMANTIPSSWEFVNCTFTIQNVTRACAQQITRTRFTPMDSDIFGSYAMQSQRVTDMSEVTYDVPAGVIEAGAEGYYKFSMDESIHSYGKALMLGVDTQDARGLLPMNSHCNLVVSYNLRTLAELFRKRESLRVQGEFVDIVRAMRSVVEKTWPWSAPFFVPKDAAAIAIIEGIAATLPQHQQRELAKAADLIKVGG